MLRRFLPLIPALLCGAFAAEIPAGTPITVRMIDKVEPYFNGGLLLDLKGGEKIEVSRRQAVKFKEMMSL